MNKPALITVLAALCVALGYVALSTPDVSESPPLAADPRLPEAAGSADPPRNPGLASEDVPPRAVPLAPATHPLAVFREAATRHPAGVDPMIVFALEQFSDEQIAAYNELHVIPFNPAVGKLCESVPDDRFPDRDQEVRRCETVRERPPHPYTQLADADLEALAETDPAAAVIRGMRVAGKDEERNRWYLRAAALSGKSGPILALANRRYSTVQTYKRNAEGRLVAIDDVDGVRYRAVLESIAARMGDPRANPDYWLSVLTGFGGAAADLRAVERESLAIMSQMAEIQREITGSTQMWELIHAV